jgi:hypothetical protein
VKQLGKKSGKNLWIAPNTRTCPTGVNGIIQIIMTGINVKRSLTVRLPRKRIRERGKLSVRNNQKA